MIKSDKGNVQIKELGIEVLSDFSMITMCLFENLQKNVGEKAEEVIRDYFESGLEKSKEKSGETPDVLDEIEHLLKLIKEIKEK